MVISRKARDGAPLTTVLCEGCGLARTEPLPSPEQQAGWYRDSYRLVYKGALEPKLHRVLRSGTAALDRIRRLRQHIAPGMRLLDVGSGSGEVVYLLGAMGCRVTGIEPNRGYAAFAHDRLGLDVRAGTAEEQEFPTAEFDGIMLFHVLEHISSPVAFLTRLAAWLKPEGFFAIEAPNLESRCQHPAHRFHQAHVLHFNRATLLRCGELAGLTSLRCETSGDEGNLLAVFRPDPGMERNLGPIPGNFERLWQLEQRQSSWAYWFSPLTFRRAVARLWSMARERVLARRFGSFHSVLDSLARSGHG